MNAITPHALATALAHPNPPLVLDVRRLSARSSSGQQIPGALWRDPALWLDWKDDIAKHPLVAMYCAHGQEISQALTTALRILGAQATYLEGGFAAWVTEGQPLAPILSK